MKRSSLLRLLVVIGLSLMLIFALNSFVFAVDDFDWDNVTIVTDNNTATDASQSTVDYNALIGNNQTGVAETTNDTTGNNTANTSENAMPYTGIEDVNTMVVLVAVVGVIVAIYSYKKIRDYKNV